MWRREDLASCGAQAFKVDSAEEGCVHQPIALKRGE
jgi:hypothetical protein